MTVLALRRKQKEAPADIAAAIEKPEVLVLAEAEREQLEARRADLRKRIAVAHDEFDNSRRAARDLATLSEEEAALGIAIEANRGKLLSARRAYGEVVVAGLQPIAEAAARQFLAALEDADSALDILAAVDKAKADAECRAAYPSRRLEATHLSNLCHRIVAASSKGALGQ